MKYSLLGLLFSVAASVYAITALLERNAELASEREMSARYAAVLAACANGNDFSIGEHRIQCRKAKR